MLVIHLFNHVNFTEAIDERQIDHLDYHLKWEKAFADTIVRRSLEDKLITCSDEGLYLTDAGRRRAKQTIEI